jgi:hypothetical protein
MKNKLLSAAFTFGIFGLIGLLVMALMVEPLIVGGLIVFVTMAMLYILIHKILEEKAD